MKRNYNKTLFLLFFAVVAAAVYWYINPAAFSKILPQKISDQISKKIAKIEALAPLVGDKRPSQVVLTKSGIFIFTNSARENNSEEEAFLPDTSLDEVAAARVDDMFAKQYFEHVSPTGESASDIADEIGYSYISLGENIALGNFASDQALVEAWMNSPGHRANIVGTQFNHIGIAAKKGMYQGDEIWIAAQIFGRPLSDCPPVSAALKLKIENNQVLIEQMKAQADKLYAEMRSGSKQQYNQKAAQYNTLVEQINAKISETKALVSQYNKEVQTFNACIQ